MLKKLLKQRAEKQKKLKDLLSKAETEERNLTVDESTEYDKLDKEFDDLTEHIERVKKTEAREKELDLPQTPPLAGGTRGGEATDKKLTDEQVQRYSLFNVIRALESNDPSLAEYEVGISKEIAKEQGIHPRGILIPPQIQQRAVLSTANTGALVATEHRDDLYIESLKAESIVLQMGARMIPDLVGDMDIPRSMGGMSFSFVGEDDDSPDIDTTFDSVNFSPKTITGSVTITRKLTKQSSPYIEQLIEDDMRTGMALMIDKVVLAGDGTGNTPVGILNTTGVNTVSVADTDDGIPNFAETVGFETELAENNALRGVCHYVTTPKINGAWKTKPIDAGSGIMVNTNNMVNGYKSIGTTLMPTGKTIFGNFSDVIIATWGTMDLVLDTATMAKKGGIVLRAWHEMDVGIRHPQSFTVTG